VELPPILLLSVRKRRNDWVRIRAEGAYLASPYPQYPQQATYGPGPLAPPPPPGVMIRARRLMLAGGVLSVAYGIVDGLTLHHFEFYSATPTTTGTTVHHLDYVLAGVVSGVIDCLLWLWMAWKTRAGRNWARVLSCVFFGFMCLSLLSALPSVSLGAALLDFLLVVAEWAVGLAALLQLWRPESSQFFAAGPAGETRGPVFPALPGCPLRRPGPGIPAGSAVRPASAVRPGPAVRPPASGWRTAQRRRCAAVSAVVAARDGVTRRAFTLSQPGSTSVLAAPAAPSRMRPASMQKALV
jgi:hypothetical protein